MHIILPVHHEAEPLYAAFELAALMELMDFISEECPDDAQAGQLTQKAVEMCAANGHKPLDCSHIEELKKAYEEMEPMDDEAAEEDDKEEDGEY